MPYLSASAVAIHYEEALYQVYVPLPLPLEFLKLEAPADYTSAIEPVAVLDKNTGGAVLQAITAF